MKFTTTILCISFGATTVSAFSPSLISSNSKLQLYAEASSDAVDRSLKGIDDAADHSVFDPLTGSRPALIRNNNEEVWVPQVTSTYMLLLYSLRLGNRASCGWENPTMINLLKS